MALQFFDVDGSHFLAPLELPFVANGFEPADIVLRALGEVTGKHLDVKLIPLRVSHTKEIGVALHFAKSQAMRKRIVEVSSRFVKNPYGIGEWFIHASGPNTSKATLVAPEFTVNVVSDFAVITGALAVVLESS